jgi:hypothetical protein
MQLSGQSEALWDSPKSLNLVKKRDHQRDGVDECRSHLFDIRQEMSKTEHRPTRSLGVAGRAMCMVTLRIGEGLWPKHAARTRRSRRPQSAGQEDRECRCHNHEIVSRAVKTEICDGSKQQREQQNPRDSCDRCYQLKPPTKASSNPGLRPAFVPRLARAETARRRWIS